MKIEKRTLPLWLLLLLFSISCATNKKIISASADTESSASTDTVYSEIFDERIYQPEREKIHDLLHTQLHVSFDWEKRRLNGKATLELKPYFYPQKKVTLDAKNFLIHAVQLVSAEGVALLEYEYDDLKLHIYLDREYTRDERYILQIDYTARPYEREAGGSLAINSDRGLFFINADGSDPGKPRQIWTQGETEYNSFWFPTIDSPNEKTTQEMYITVDEKYVTLSNGVLISSVSNDDGSRTDYWKMDQPHAPYLFMMAVGEFEVVKDEWRGLDITYYVEPEYKKYARDIFGNTPEMMTFFSDLLDYEYPWAKYAQVVVRDYVSGAMENTTASVFMEDLQVDDRELLDYHWDGIIAHELFHHWFGNLVTCESWANLPLNEAFANYSEYLWSEYKYGKDEADYHHLQEMNQYLQEAESKRVDLIRFYHEDSEDMFDSHSYAKGGRILHMLRNYVGDEAFFKSLNFYLRQNEYQDVEVHNLRLAFEEVTGQDLNWFFNQWFLASGHPEIKVRHRYANGSLKLEIWQLQDPVATPIYKLPVDIKMWVNEKQITYSLMIEDAYQVFELPMEAKPDLVVFDEKRQMLAEIDHEKSVEELVFQYRNGERFAARNEALTLLASNVTDNAAVLMEALDDPFWVLRQKAISAFEEYRGPLRAQLESKLKMIARQDPKSLVRADALNALAALNLNGHKDLFVASLEDSSYSVLGVSLMALAESDFKDKAQLFAQYENIDNLNVFLPIANYYAQSNQHRKYDWFREKLKNLQGADLWYMLQFFGEYLMDAPEDQKKSGASILENEARNNSSYYIRLAAYQALGLLEDLDGIDKIREDIRKKETDNRLNKIYSNIN